MTKFETCPCGIAKVDCEYHKPEKAPSPDFPATLCKCGMVYLTFPSYGAGGVLHSRALCVTYQIQVEKPPTKIA